MKKHQSIAAFALIVFFTISAASVRGAACPVKLGMWGNGEITAVAADGDLAFAAAGPVLLGYRVIDAHQPQLASRVKLPAALHDIAVDNDLVVVALGPEGIAIIDFSDPFAPLVLSTIAVAATTIALHGRQLVVCSSSWGPLVFYDLSDATSPVSQGTLNNDFADEWVARDMIAVDDLYAYWLAGEEVAVIEYHPPGGPQVLRTSTVATSLYYSSDPIGIVADQGTVYAAHSEYPISVGESRVLLRSFRVTSSGWLINTGTWQESSTWSSFDVTNGVAALSSFQSVRFISVSDPARPTLVAQLLSDRSPIELAIGRDFVLAFETDAGFIDTSDQSQPQWAADLPSIGRLAAVTASGENIYVLSHHDWSPASSDITILKLTPHGTPVTDAVIAGAVPGFIDATADDGLLIATTTDERLAVYDLSNPTAPVLIGDREVGSFCELAVADRMAYLNCANTESIQIVDLSNPAVPHHINDLTLSRQASHITARGGKLFVSRLDELAVYGLSAPGHPNLIKEFDFDTGIIAFAADQTHLFVATTPGVHSIDLATLTATGFAPLQNVQRLAVTGDFLWASLNNGPVDPLDDLVVFDISDPAHLELVGSPSDPQGFLDVLMVGSRAIVASARDGIASFDLECMMHIDNLTPRYDK